MVEGGGVGLLPALCLRRIAWVLFTLLTESRLLPSSVAMATAASAPDAVRHGEEMTSIPCHFQVLIETFDIFKPPQVSN